MATCRGCVGHRAQDGRQRGLVGSGLDARHRRGAGLLRAGGRPGRARRRRRPGRRGRRCGAGCRAGWRAPRCACSGASSESGLATPTVRRLASSGSYPRRSNRPGADERVAQHLDQPLVGQGVGDEAPDPLAVRQPVPGRGLRQDRGDLVVAAHPRDLLDEVGAVAEVGAPRRRQHRHDVTLAEGVGDVRDPAGLGDLAADGPQDGEHLLARVVQADVAAGQADVEVERPAGRAVVDVGDARVGAYRRRARRAGRRPARPPRRDVGVDAALEALGRLGGEAVAARGAGHGRRGRSAPPR